MRKRFFLQATTTHLLLSINQVKYFLYIFFGSIQKANGMKNGTILVHICLKRW